MRRRRHLRAGATTAFGGTTAAVAELPRIDTTTCQFRNLVLGEVIQLDGLEFDVAVVVHAVEAVIGPPDTAAVVGLLPGEPLLDVDEVLGEDTGWCVNRTKRYGSGGVPGVIGPGLASISSDSSSFPGHALFGMREPP